MASPLERERTEPVTVWPWEMRASIMEAATKPFAPVTRVLGIAMIVGAKIWLLGLVVVIGSRIGEVEIKLRSNQVKEQRS